MKTALVLRESGDDWYVIERAEHDNRHWMKPTEYGAIFMYSGRISDADVEGTTEEMRAIGRAIEVRGRVSFKRCAVDAMSDPVKLWSPRNSQEPGSVSLESAQALAERIRALTDKGKQ